MSPSQLQLFSEDRELKWIQTEVPLQRLTARQTGYVFFLSFHSVSLSRLPGFPSCSLAWYRHMTFSHRAGPDRFHLLQHPRVHHLADSTKARNLGRRAGNRGVIETSFSTARAHALVRRAEENKNKNKIKCINYSFCLKRTRTDVNRHRELLLF